ncbi:hypothetical protein WAF17_10220 [Bernardetia sp. ABR2-2B]|uniref:hypothetical protein n=1 Tax=Bernardetia sp. ABR2-2B TaxID=3127472 RepID=UPI0030D10BA4
MFILYDLDKNDSSGSCGIPSIIIAFIPLIINFIWSCATIFLVSKSAEKQYFDDTSLYVIIAIIGNSLIAYLAESYLWLLLMIPYILFLGESFYLKFARTQG